MTHLSSIFEIGLLEEMIADGFIRTHHHDNGDLVGYNYTEKAQFDRAWNDATLNCRGLIADTDGNVIARPFKKFFNLGEQPTVDAQYEGRRYYMATKWDGSLGIHYAWGGEDWIATRGSFHSKQATWATHHYRECPTSFSREATDLYEIIYPENRIVVDYGGMSGLRYLATIDISTGLTADVEHQGIPSDINPLELKPKYRHLDDGNHEGFVLVYGDDHRVKVKFDEYVRRHRFISHCSNRSIWELIANGRGLDELIEVAPDEYHEWIREQRDSLERQFVAMFEALYDEYGNLIAQVGFRDRKAFAMAAKESDLRSLLFMLLDDKDVGPAIWKMLRPEVIEYPGKLVRA